MLRKVINIRNVCIACTIYVVVILSITLYKTPMEISIIDVGQGDAIYIKTPSGKIVLIDAGGFYSERSDAGSNIIVPFLLDKKVSTIDVIFISHTDRDHICGMDDIANTFKIKKVILSNRVKNDKLIDIIKNAKAQVLYINEYGKINFEKNIIFEVYTTKTVYNDINDDESLVVGLQYKKKNFIFMGDASTDIEKELFSKINKNYDILKTGHHGSKTSTSEEYLSRINPKIALISVGADNKFGHPSKSVIDNLTKKNIEIFRTDINGCISVFSNGEYLRVKTMRGD